MAEDLTNILEKLQQALGGQQNGDGLSALLNGLSNNNRENKENESAHFPDDSQSSPIPVGKPSSNYSVNPDMIAKIQRVYERINTNQDPRISLLTALKPYLNNKRADHIDSAVKILNLTKLSGIMKDIE